MEDFNSNQLIPCQDGTHADPSIGCVETPSGIVNANTGISELMVQIANGLMTALITAATISLVYGALHYITSRGNQDQMDKGKRILFWSAFGLVVGLMGKLILVSVLEWVG